MEPRCNYVRKGNSSERKPDLLHPVLQTKGADQHRKNLKTYAAAKEHQEGVSSYILEHHPELRKEFNNLSTCGQFLIYHHYFTVGEYRLRGGFTCKQHLLCNCCAIRRSSILVKTYSERFLHLLKEEPDYVPVLITKTIKNGPDLLERYKHISAAHRKLIQTRRYSRKSSTARVDSVLRYVLGAAGSYEIKIGSGSGDWHVHMHEVALLDRRRFTFTEQTRKGKKVSVPLEFEAALREEWKKITKDSYILDVRRIELDMEKEEDFCNGFCEAFKYSLKLNELNKADQIHAYKTLKGRRLVFNYGALYGLEVPDGQMDIIADLEQELLPYEELLYRWERRRYVLKERRVQKDASEWPPRRKTAEERRAVKERRAAQRKARMIKKAESEAQMRERLLQKIKAPLPEIQGHSICCDPVPSGRAFSTTEPRPHPGAKECPE